MIFFILSLAVFFIAVVIHECSHGWVAYKLGDPTAKYAGRLTLNPLAHIDPVGTIMLPLLLRLTGSPIIFGWAKPVPVNFWNLRNPKRDMIWVGLAGPTANILLAVTLSAILKIGLPIAINQLIEIGVLINLVLAFFNLIPVPPLDGSRIIMGLLPQQYSLKFAKIEPYGFVIVIVLLMAGIFDNVIWPVVRVVASALMP